MNKLICSLSLLTLLAAGCGRKTEVTIEQKPEPVNKPVLETSQYTLTTSYGHQFNVTVSRFPKEDHGYNNTCKINYILTNTGNKDFLHREVFNDNSRGKAIKNGEPAIVFEFTTADGKKIEKNQSIYFDISAGRSSEVYTMSIDVGQGTCSGEVKPIRIDYREQP